MLHGRVEDAEGRAVSGAAIVWRALPAPDYSTQHDWSIREAMLTELGSRSATSDERGLYRFESAPPKAEEGSALWVYHPDYEATPFQITAAELGSDAPVECRLERRSSLSVEVVTADGEPVLDATVHHRGVRPVPAEPAYSWLARAYRILARDLEREGEGAIALSPPGGRHLLWARGEGGESEPWFGEGSGAKSVTLVLRPTFEVSGLVRSHLDAPLPSGLRVSAFRDDVGGARALEQAWVASDGAWGPMNLPFDETWEYYLELNGEGVVAVQATVPRPTSGERVWVELDAKPAPSLAVTVLDEESQAVPGAVVAAWWSLETGGALVRQSTNEKGLADFKSCAPTTVYIDVSKPGYALPSNPSVDLSGGAASTTVTLERAGRIVGKCVHGGQPVSDQLLVHRVLNLLGDELGPLDARPDRAP